MTPLHTPNAMLQSCVMCNTSPARRCSRCTSCFYCSPQCQQSDWPSHRLLCQSWASQDPRPSSNHIRAIFFLQDCERPLPIWLRYKQMDPEPDDISSYPWDKIDFETYLGADKPFTGRHTINNNPIRDRVCWIYWFM